MPFPSYRLANRRAALPFALALAAVAAAAPFHTVLAQDKPVATINGKPVSEADLKLAETEIGSELAQVPEGTRRRILRRRHRCNGIRRPLRAFSTRCSHTPRKSTVQWYLTASASAR